jgi:hypothetical protein
LALALTVFITYNNNNSSSSNKSIIHTLTLFPATPLVKLQPHSSSERRLSGRPISKFLESLIYFISQVDIITKNAAVSIICRKTKSTIAQRRGFIIPTMLTVQGAFVDSMCALYQPKRTRQLHPQLYHHHHHHHHRHRHRH